jgi:DNA-binding NarL/FixJ family response regulator
MPDQALPGPPPLRVLVADDNPVVRAGLAALLDAHPDIQVTARASNGAEALTAATRHRPDVILLDVRMPGTDGLTALPSLAGLAPVMMLTYSREPEVVAQALSLGAVGYLVHGEFTADELITAVRDLSDGRATFTASAGRLAAFRRLPPRPPPGRIHSVFRTNRTKSLRMCNRLWHSRRRLDPPPRRHSTVAAATHWNSG